MEYNNEMKLKDTLHLPTTEFEMRGNLAKKEPGIIENWNNINIYEKLLAKNEGKETFMLHDGPPYANGNIHVGHALNKILKDMVVKSKTAMGYKAPFIPGWDTHGLPIEQALTNSGVNRKEMSVAQFRVLCEKYAWEQVAIQKEQFKRLGVIADWENPYVTLQPEMEARQIEVFQAMVARGMIFKGLKPVYWSPSSESALAEAEIEYMDKRSPSIHVAFKILKPMGILAEGTEVVIWTTTPWTMPANRAVALGKDIEYSLVEAAGRKFLVASVLVEDFIAAVGYEEFNVVATAKGSELFGATYAQPMTGAECPVVSGHHVTTDGGTGVVHIAPGHGEDDYIIGRENDLEVFSAVDGEGKMVTECGDLVAGMFYEEANKEIGMKLTDEGKLLKFKTIKHSYPHDWRTKKPVMFRATPQWFASIDVIKSDILSEIEKVKWIPGWGEKRIHNMIADRVDWCISRQRAWGVPIPIFYCENEEAILDMEVFTHVSNLFREHGSNIWFEWDTKDLLPEGYTNPNSPNGTFTKEMDIMDVWFDSGSTHTSVLLERGYDPVADLILEGSDQYRGWFNSSIITGVAKYGKSPYKAVLTHGFVLDGKGQKMSKSVGNVISPLDIADKYGADVLRLWVASTQYQADVKVSDEIIKQASDAYRKIRNTIRFMLGTIDGFNFATDAQEKLAIQDEYILIKLNKLIAETKTAYEDYNFNAVSTAVNNFVNNDLSSFYLNFIKDITYINKEDDVRRKQVLTTVFHLLNSLMKILIPILPHTMEEMYKDFARDGKHESVLLEDYATLINIDGAEAIEAELDKFMLVRADILKAMEESKDVVTKAAKTALTISLKDEYKDVMKDYAAEILMVASLNVADNDGIALDTATIKVELHSGTECKRCRKAFNADKMHDDTVCKTCFEIIESM